MNEGFFTYDVWRLRDLVAAAAKHTGSERAGLLSEAVDLYGGPYMAASPYGWAQVASRGVDREVIQALMQLARLMTDPDQAIVHLERATGIDVTAEHVCQARMEMYAKLGRAEGIHHAYEQLVESLKLRGRGPKTETTHLYQRLTRAE